MARDINVVVLTGRLADEPELKKAGNQTLVTFRLINSKPARLVDNQWKEQTPNYFTVLLWGQAGERLKPYLTKGKQVAVTGRLQQRSYQLPDEARSRSVVEVVASDIQLLGGRPDASAVPSPPAEVPVPDPFAEAPSPEETRFSGGGVGGGPFRDRSAAVPSWPADSVGVSREGPPVPPPTSGADGGRLEPPEEDPFAPGGGGRAGYDEDDLPF